MKFCRNWIDSFESRDVVRPGFGFDEFKKIVQFNNWHENLANKVITVAGTNGKGGCVKVLHNLAVKSKLNVLSFTSPHLLELNERFFYNYQNIDYDILAEKIKYIDTIAKNSYQFSFFETLTLACFSLAKDLKPDLLILEIGLGGRLDAVNTTRHDCAVITSIGLDHQEVLGDTLQAIAAEKAGIIRENTPVVWGDNTRVPKAIEHRAKQMNAQLLLDYNNNYTHGYLSQSSLNAAKIAWQYLYPNALSCEEVNRVVFDSKLKARYEVIKVDKKQIIIDVAHNIDAVNHLLKNLGQVKVAVIMALNKNRDSQLIIDRLTPVVDAWYCLDLPNKRLLTAHDLQLLIAQDASIINARQIKKTILNCKNNLILIFGSFYVAEAFFMHVDY